MATIGIQFKFLRNLRSTGILVESEGYYRTEWYHSPIQTAQTLQTQNISALDFISTGLRIDRQELSEILQRQQEAEAGRQELAGRRRLGAGGGRRRLGVDCGSRRPPRRSAGDSKLGS